jgi:hypothetical protein
MRKPSECHPEKFNYAHGKCKSCYEKHKWATNSAYRESRLRKERAWYQKNKAKRTKHSRDWYAKKKAHVRAYHLKIHYGLTPDDYKTMYDAQNGLCAICCLTVIECVDHDHNTSIVRGLLCTRCNLCLGHYEELQRKGLLESVTKYLGEHKK